MPVLFKNPDLLDYFFKVTGVAATSDPRDVPSIVKPYEQGKVIYFPELKLELDHDFWTSLPTDDHPALKKLSSTPGQGDFARDPLLERRLADSGAPADMQRRLKREIGRVYEQVLPLYEALFAGYRFVRRQVVWRLTTIRNENLHVDTYQTDFEDHFARLFINLDDQPRIWMTSFTIEQMFELYAPSLPREVLLSAEPGEIRKAVNELAFGGRSNVWWDRQPRHVAYFEPGEAWAVDSRQVAHQIFYGRRAVSIDFFVDRSSMIKPKRYYLRLAEELRRRTLAALPAAAE